MTSTVGTDLKIHIWYDEDLEAIKIRIGGELTSVYTDPEKKRGHPHLYKKLAAALRDAGKKHPSGVL